MILIRADSSFEIGTGHIMRCLHLARLLKKMGKEVQFLCQELPGNINSTIESLNFRVHAFTQQGQDLSLVEKLKPAHLIIDHYGINEDWQKQVSAPIFVIDDLMNRKHRCEALLDQNYRRDFNPYKKLIPANAKLLAGPRYCLLPDSLQKAPAAKSLPAQPKILSFFGGADSSGELLKLAQALISAKFIGEVSLVALKSHKHLEALKALKLPANFALIIDPPDWHKLLSDSDVYIGSGGTVTWERLYLGLPGAVIAVADNQETPSRELADDGYQSYWGAAKDFDYSKLAEKLSALLTEKQTLHRYSEKGLQLVSKFDAELAQDFFS